MSWAMIVCFFFSSRRRHTRCGRDWSSDVCSSDLGGLAGLRRDREGDQQRDRDAPPGPDPTTPLRHPERSMANVSVCVVKRLVPVPLGSPAVARAYDLAEIDWNAPSGGRM